jgi:hypothetical protein
VAVNLKGYRKIVVEGRTFYWKVAGSLAIIDCNKRFFGYIDTDEHHPTPSIVAEDIRKKLQTV